MFESICIRKNVYRKENVYEVKLIFEREYRVSHTSYVKYKERNIDILLNTYVCL